MKSSMNTAIVVGLPPPNRNVRIVAELAAQPGQMFGRTAQPMKIRPQGFQNRAKPATAVSPVASV